MGVSSVCSYGHGLQAVDEWTRNYIQHNLRSSDWVVAKGVKLSVHFQRRAGVVVERESESDRMRGGEASGDIPACTSA